MTNSSLHNVLKEDNETVLRFKDLCIYNYFAIDLVERELYVFNRLMRLKDYHEKKTVTKSKN